MPSKPNKSPFATTFKSAINRGTPCWTAICNIANRSKKTPQVVCNSLFKAGFVNRCKFNGQWIYWPNFPFKASASSTKNCQFNTWQHFIEWCIASGCCTPQQLDNHNGSQKAFMTFCRKFWNQQFNASSSSSSKRRSSKSTPRARKSTPKRTRRASTPARSYKFPQTGRRVRRYAA